MESTGLYLLETIIGSLLRYLTFLFSVGVVLYLAIRLKGPTAFFAILGLSLQTIALLVGLYLHYGLSMMLHGDHEQYIRYLQINSVVSYIGYALMLFCILRWLQQHLPNAKTFNSAA